MSNKTTFKRIALGVVATLGFGILSAAPSSATISSVGVSLTRAGTATATVSDSTTAAVISVSGFFTSATETITVTFTEDGAARPLAGTGYDTTVASGVILRYGVLDTLSTGTQLRTSVKTVGVTEATAAVVAKPFSLAESHTTTAADSYTAITAAANSTGGATFWVQLDSRSALGYGVYNAKAVVTVYSAGAAPSTTILPFTITVATPAAVTTAAAAAADKVVDPSKSTAIMSLGSTFQATTLDSAVSLVSTASATNQAIIRVVTQNASSLAVNESITATISGAGTVCSETGQCGPSLTFAGDGSYDIGLRADGRAGVATIAISTPTKTFTSKSATFYAADPAAYAPSLDVPVIGIGTTADVVSIAATDSNKSVWGGTNLYLYSSDTTIASNATCTFNATDKVHYCPVVGVKAGETKWTIGNKSTLATSTVKSAEFAGPRVTAEVAASVKIEFNKAAYAPGEKALIYVTPLDAAGKAIAGGSIANLLATGGISASVAFASGSDTTTATTLAVASASSATTGAKAGSAMYTVYMPFGKGTVTLTAKGGTGLPIAAQVALTASASVVDDSVDAAVDAAQEATDAAIAATDAAILAQEAADEAASAAIAAQETAQAAVDAVTALSAEVTKLVAQLATLQKLLNRVAKRVGVKL